MSEALTGRPKRVADAALAVLGGAGSRGLTHRAVDAAAGLPQGSTSYYCRRRLDLLALAERRLLELDRRDVAELVERLAAGPPTAEDVADAVAALLVDWLTPPKRTRTIARYELYLDATRQPTLDATMARHFAVFIDLASRIGGAAATSDTVSSTLLLAEGIALTVLRTGATPDREAIARLLRASLLS